MAQVDLTWQPPDYGGSINAFQGFYVFAWDHVLGGWAVLKNVGQVTQHLDTNSYDFTSDFSARLSTDSTNFTDYNAKSYQGLAYYQIMGQNNNVSLGLYSLNIVCRKEIFPYPDISADNVCALGVSAYTAMPDYKFLPPGTSVCAGHYTGSSDGCPNVVSPKTFGSGEFLQYSIKSLSWYNNTGPYSSNGGCNTLLHPMGKWNCLYHNYGQPFRKFANAKLTMYVQYLFVDYYVEVVLYGVGLRMINDINQPWEAVMYVKGESADGISWSNYSGNSGLSGNCSLNWVTDTNVALSKCFPCYLGAKKSYFTERNYDGFLIGVDPWLGEGQTYFPAKGFFAPPNDSLEKRLIKTTPPSIGDFPPGIQGFGGINYFERLFGAENKYYKVWLRDRAMISLSDYGAGNYKVYDYLNYYTWPGSVMSLGVIRAL